MSGKMLLIDCETSPNVGLFWSAGRKINIPPENIIQERKIICISYKFRGADEPVRHLTWDKNQEDKEMLRKFSRVAEKADVIMGHNSDKFDVRWIKGRMVINDLPPLTVVSTADTLKMARRNFYFNSNRLDYIGKVLGVGRKVDTGGFDLWRRTMNGDRKALAEMVHYCDNDVLLLEAVLDKIEPHCVNPTYHRGLLNGNSRLSCDACGSSKVHANRAYYNKTGKQMQLVTCRDCGKSKSLTMNVFMKLRGIEA